MSLLQLHLINTFRDKMDLGTPIDIKKNDVLFVIDMQYDFMDCPDGDEELCQDYTSKLPTKDATDIIHCIVYLMFLFFFKKGYIVASNDYHPEDHVSFNTVGGVFEPHCVQGTHGNKIVAPIQNFIDDHPENCIVAYKAYDSDIDSFGAFPYSSETAIESGIKMKNKCKKDGKVIKDCLEKTGAYILDEDNHDVNLMAHLVLKGVRQATNKLFICGVLGDFCVLNTAINASINGYKNVYIILDAIRSLVVKEELVYTYEMWVKKATKYEIKFCLISQLEHNFTV